MLSRQDDENLFIMFSDNPHYWSDPASPPAPGRDVGVREDRQLRLAHRDRSRLARHHPRRRPDAQVLHRRGAARSGRPHQVIGRLREPLLSPEGNEREGYVPNVVYSCGSLLHGRELILPYAMSDKASAIVSVSLDELLAALLENAHPPKNNES